jgi:hypothetical protein
MKNLIKSFAARCGYRISRRGFVPVVTRIFQPQFDDRAFVLLGPDLRKGVDWPRKSFEAEASLALAASGTLWKGIPGGHKWTDYFAIYDREFSHLRGRQIRVLEIGVYRGASLKLWREFFGPACTIVGVDIDEKCRAFEDASRGTYVRIGSQADPGFLQSVVRELGPFDLILDDGSHVSSHQIASFNALFQEGLRDDGLYFIEDLEGSYWGDTTGQLDQRVSAVDFLKMLVDLPNSVFRGHTYADFSINLGVIKSSYVVPRIATLIDSIKFYRGVAIVQKGQPNPPTSYHL